MQRDSEPLTELTFFSGRWFTRYRALKSWKISYFCFNSTVYEILVQYLTRAIVLTIPVPSQTWNGGHVILAWNTIILAKFQIPLNSVIYVLKTNGYF